MLIWDEEGFEFSISKCWSWKIYISVWKKGLINRRGKDLDWREEQSKGENLLGNFHSSGRKICWEKSDECLRLFHREADFLLGTTDVERGWRSFDQKEKSKRKEAEEETSVETKRSLLSSHSWRGIKSRGLLIPASLSLYFSTNLDKAGYSPTVLIIFNSSRLGNVR